MEPFTPDEAEYTGVLVRRIQGYLRHGSLFLEYAKDLGRNRISEVSEDDIQKLFTMLGKKHGQSELNNLRTFLDKLFRRARKWNLIEVSPIDEDIKSVGKKSADKEHLDPYCPEKIVKILAAARTKALETTFEWKRNNVVRDMLAKETVIIDRKVCWYALIFLATVGARPPELRRVNNGDNTLTLNELGFTGESVRVGGKTIGATRNIELTPVLRHIFEDTDFIEAMRTTMKFASRLRQYFRRNELGELYPYRFRKSVASILIILGQNAEHVSYLLGHSNPKVTCDFYIRQYVFKKGEKWGEKKLKHFWTWPNEEYFDKPQKKWK